MDVPDFDAVYRADPDPWRVRSSFYERRKLEVVVACLDRPEYGTAWDPACGVGELTARLSTRADRVLASDASAEAVSLTRARTADLSPVEVRHQALPGPPPAGWPEVDLVVLSEFFYYLGPADRTASLAMIDDVSAAESELVSLHWRHKPHDAYLSGADVQGEIRGHLRDHGWRHILHHEDRDFVLDSHTRGRAMTTRLQVTPGGHDPSVWAPQLAAAPRVPVTALISALTGRTRESDPAGPTELVVLAAHPDDETLGLARLAYAWARMAGPVTGVLATSGEACVDHVMPRPADIVTVRLAEWHAALDLLGFTDRLVLDLPDGRLAERQDTLTAELGQIVAERTAVGRRVVLAAPWRGDPHPDHRAAGRAAAEVARATGLPMLEFGIWMTYWAEPTAVRERGQQLLVVTTDPAFEPVHRAACRAFVSQLEPLTPHLTPVVPAAMLAHQSQQLVIVSPDLATTISPSGGCR